MCPSPPRCPHPFRCARRATQEPDATRGAAADCFFQGHIVTVEMTNGNAYRGKLLDGKLPLPLPLPRDAPRKRC